VNGHWIYKVFGPNYGNKQKCLDQTTKLEETGLLLCEVTGHMG